MSSPRRERDTSSPPVCVVWHAAGSPPSATLCNALAKRGIQLTLCQSSSIAVARLLNAARHIDDDTVLIMLLVDPHKLDAAPDAIDVVQRFAPACRCWMYDERDTTPLREITPDDLLAWRNRAPEPPRAPQLKLVPTDPELDLAEEPPVPAQTAPDADDDLEGLDEGHADLTLTDDEINSLLDDIDDTHPDPDPLDDPRR